MQLTKFNNITYGHPKQLPFNYSWVSFKHDERLSLYEWKQMHKNKNEKKICFRKIVMQNFRVVVTFCTLTQCIRRYYSRPLKGEAPAIKLTVRPKVVRFLLSTSLQFQTKIIFLKCAETYNSLLVFSIDTCLRFFHALLCVCANL